MARVISDDKKPIVGIIYSDSIKNSLESKSLAFYLSGCLVSTGYAKVKLFCHNSESSSLADLQLQHRNLNKGVISYLPVGKSSLKDIITVSVAGDNSLNQAPNVNSHTNTPQISFAHWNELQNCPVIIATVNSDDTESCCLRLAEVLPDSIYNIVVFSLQRGVRNGGILKAGLSNVVTNTNKQKKGNNSSNKSNSSTISNIAVIDGLLAFACVPILFPTAKATNQNKTANYKPEHGNGGTKSNTSSIKPLPCYYACTLLSPTIVLERVSKETSLLADGAMNLLETLDFDIIYKKTLTPYAWGTLIYEHLYTLNIITGGGLRNCLINRENRLVLAFMVRESREVLLTAAKRGKWSPQMSQIAFCLTPYIYEMILILPNFIFFILLYIISILYGHFNPWEINIIFFGDKNTISPGLFDLKNGRKTMIDSHLYEIISVGKRHKIKMSICEAVFDTIKVLENNISTDVKSIEKVNNEKYNDKSELKGRMYIITSAYDKLIDNTWYNHPTVREFSYHIFIFFIFLFIFINFVRRFIPQH